jgi:predicted acetylornithine/succinylornithine family transaminase
MQLKDVKKETARLLVPTYARAEVVFTRGEGVYLFDGEGKRYLDFAAGIAVTTLGHSHPDVVEAVAQQAGELMHVSNLYHTLPQLELAKRLVNHSFADKVFFSNSGSEANETALKFARKWGRNVGGAEKVEIVAFEGAFHGRTCGALSITHKTKYREPFQPLLPCVSFAPFNDLSAAKALITPNTCAVFVEPIQGEGGIQVATAEFLSGLRELCDEHNALLVFDEVQCGLGRTGMLWAHEHYGVVPDVMTLAKPLAGGLPIGVTLVKEKVSAVIEHGDHGSTFGGGPMVCRSGVVTFDHVCKDELLKQVIVHGDLLRRALSELTSSSILNVRGLGLLVGVEFDRPVAPLVSEALARGLVVITAGERVLRLCPPLIVSAHEIESAVGILEECLLQIVDER